MQYAYEDRIAELRARVDRTTSRQLLDQEQFDQKLDQIMRRQTALESRATALGAIPDASVTGSIRPPGRGAATDAPAGTPKPSPISDTVIFVAPPDREARLESRAPRGGRAAAQSIRQGPGVRQCCGQAADVARPGRAAANGGTLFRGRQSGIAGATNARRHQRPRPRHGAAGSRNPAKRRRRTLRPREACCRCQPVRSPALSHQCHPRAGRSAEPHAFAGALPQARDRRSRIHLRLWRAQRSVPGPARDAHRPRFPRRHRRPRARHRQWQGGLVRLAGRLWPHDRDRSRQWPVDPLRPSLRDQRQGRRDTSRSAR